ncbi:MAG: XcyI family restriction endonuclease [Rhodospirillales bacterium]|nr:XcyI family restriction endonuclease [Rhodospirillales bacterium]
MFEIPDPELQIGFSVALAEIRNLYLQDALSDTVKSLDIPRIDRQLGTMVAKESLADLASHGLRGELLFPVPYVLRANPRLLGYYRLLFGFSQKAFYTAETGVSRFQEMEKRGTLSLKNAGRLDDLCQALIGTGSALLEGIGTSRIGSGLLDDLTLLTVGPQLRGGANVKKGAAGIVKVFDRILDIVKSAATEIEKNRIQITNAAGRNLLIEFAPDPDIIIREEMVPGSYRQLIAIEVKGGSDFSNIHNRIGEAEKSHQKARESGYNECWTVVNVDRMDMRMARRESPTTNRFYRISDIVSGKGDEYEDFRNRVISLTGIKI